MNYYDKIAQGYDGLHKEEQLKKLKIIKNYFKPKQDDSLLDVGCGTGISSDFKCKVIGIDPSIELLKLNKNKNIIQAQAENLPFKDNTFDVVVSLTAIQNFKNLENGIKEIKRVGKKRFVLTILKKSKKISEIKRFIEKNFNVKKMIEEEKDLVFLI